MEYTTLLFRKEGPIYYVQINRPEIDNKLSITCMQEITELLDEAAEDKECRAIVLSGTQKWFCSGGENGDFRKQTTMQLKRFGKAFITMHVAFQNCPRPIIAAVEGDAFGGGCSLVEACDLAVGADSALFAVPEMTSGLAPAMGFSGLYAFLPKKVAMSMGLLGEKLSAARAKELGLLNEVVPKDQVMAKATEIAEKLASLTPTGIKLFKEMYADMGQRSYENRLRIGQSMMVTLFRTEDGPEALAYKEENREPHWVDE